ncbi:membrane protein [soil metagenome]
METFTLDWGRGWLVRLFGRNQLVRRSDRIEALGVTLAVIAVMIAIPIAAAFGTWVEDARASVYVQQAVSRHQTTATAIENATLHVQVYSQTLEVQARWAADRRVHVGTVTPPETVRAGDRFDIWVDENGNHVTAPTPPSQAASDAIGSSVLLWLTVTTTLAAAVYGLHWKLNRTRYSEWDRDLDSLAGNDGGRSHH